MTRGVLAAHAARGERSEPRAPWAPAPRAVTRGESPDGAEQAQVAKVDWLNCTFAQPSMSVEGFVSFLGRLFGRPTSGEAGRGLFGFQTGVKLRVYLGGTMVDVGALAYGGCCSSRARAAACCPTGRACASSLRGSKPRSRA